MRVLCAAPFRAQRSQPDSVTVATHVIMTPEHEGCCRHSRPSLSTNATQQDQSAADAFSSCNETLSGVGESCEGGALSLARMRDCKRAASVS
jgi:hypothetical protein